MAQLMMCPGCKADIAPGEQYCRSACFLTPVPKPSEEPTAASPPVNSPGSPPVNAAPGPACGDPDCAYGGRAPAAGCRACGLGGAAAGPAAARPAPRPAPRPAGGPATTLAFAWGPVTVDAGRPLVVGRENSPVAGRLGQHSNISRKHAEFRSDGTALTVEDLRSLNGTYVNGTQLSPGQVTPLRAGDRVRFAADVEATVTGETA